MRAVFADTGYWIAIANPHDALHQAASKIGGELGTYRFVTSEMVLVELLNALGGDGDHLRRAAANVAQEIIDDPTIELVPQTHNSSATRLPFTAPVSTRIGVSRTVRRS